MSSSAQKQLKASGSQLLHSDLSPTACLTGLSGSTVVSMLLEILSPEMAKWSPGEREVGLKLIHALSGVVEDYNRMDMEADLTFNDIDRWIGDVPSLSKSSWLSARSSINLTLAYVEANAIIAIHKMRLRGFLPAPPL